MKQWELPNNSTVVLPDGTTATYLKMDGMYAQWLLPNGTIAIGNYQNIERKDGIWHVIE